MVMTTENRKRVQAGVTTGGQFAEEAKSEPQGVSVVPDLTQYRINLHDARVSALWSVEQEIADRGSAHAAATMAESIRRAFPNAATIRMGDKCDSRGCTRLHTFTVMDEGGIVLADDADGELIEISEGTGYLNAEAALQPRNEGTSSYLHTKELKDGSLVVTMDIASALDAHTECVGSPAHRAKETLDYYQAVHDDLDTEPEFVARDLLTDLHHWARANNVDLDDVFERARQYSLEEEAEDAL